MPSEVSFAEIKDMGKRLALLSPSAALHASEEHARRYFGRHIGVGYSDSTLAAISAEAQRQAKRLYRLLGFETHSTAEAGEAAK